MDKAILDGKRVVPVSDMLEWAKFLEKKEARRVAFDEIGNVRVSTVFLGLNHSWGDKPLWFETMIFEGEHDGEQWRYETWDEAVAGHANAVALVRGAP